MPQFTWALTEQGEAVHISRARPEVAYYCPTCHAAMIPRLGNRKRHHFAHDAAHTCDPKAVTAAAAKYWLARQLPPLAEANPALTATWTCPLCRDTHTTPLLPPTAAIILDSTTAGQAVDLVLQGADHRTHTAISLSPPGPSTLAAFIQAAVAYIYLPAERFHQPPDDVRAALHDGVLFGGQCSNQQAADQQGLITDRDTIRARLHRLARTSGAFSSPLTASGELTHILDLDADRLWLTPAIWAQVVGGVQHRVAPGLQIRSQEWPEPDGATIALFYVTAGEQTAVAIRRFAPGQMVTARIDSALPTGRHTTAARIAHNLAGPQAPSSP